MSLQENMSSCNNRMHSISFDKKSYPLNQYNLDLFDRQHESSKDMLYAKIFLPGGTASNNNNIISSQSLFCYNVDDDYYDDCGWQIKNRDNKLSDGRFIPRTPVKEKRNLFGFNNDEDELNDCS